MKRFAAFLLSAVLALAGDPYVDSARAKVGMIKQDQAPAGVTIPISAREWNAWIAAEVAEEKGIGLRNPKLTLAPGLVTFETLADFGKLAGRGGGAGLIAQMLSGERPVKIVFRPETSGGKCTVHLELVEISGIPLTGVLLNLAAELVLAVAFDDVHINEPFEMGHRIDHAVIDPNGVNVFIANAPPPKAAP